MTEHFIVNSVRTLYTCLWKWSCLHLSGLLWRATEEAWWQVCTDTSQFGCSAKNFEVSHQSLIIFLDDTIGPSRGNISEIYIGISTQYISGFAIGCSGNWTTENSCQWGNMPGPRETGVLNTVWTNNPEGVVCGDRMMWFSKWHRHTQKKELRVLPTGVEATTFTLARQMLYHWDIGNSWYARSLNSPNNIQEICHHGSSLTA